jgi:hypothetical protein
VLILINSVLRTSLNAVETPIARDSLWTSGKVSTFVIVSALGLDVGSAWHSECIPIVANPARVPHEPSIPVCSSNRLVIPSFDMMCPQL